METTQKKQTNCLQDVPMLIQLSYSQLTSLCKDIVDQCLAQKEVPTDDSELVTRAQAAEQLGVNLATLWRWERDGYLVPQRYGRRCRYRQSDVNRVLSAEKSQRWGKHDR
jgi:predicted DNA-binding transcriptional regulator AlpA